MDTLIYNKHGERSQNLTDYVISVTDYVIREKILE